MDIKIDNTILEKNETKETKHKMDYRIVIVIGTVATLLIGYGLYKFRGVLTSKTTDTDFINIYDIFIVILLVNIIIATIVIANFYYRIRVKGAKGVRGVRGKRGEKGKNAKCNVYSPRLIKFKPEERPGKNIENVVDPSRNLVSMDDKNKVFGVHYGWFPVEKKDLDNQVSCRDIKDETDCNLNENCRYRNGKCFKKKTQDQLNIFMGSTGCLDSQNDGIKCYDSKSINMPFNKPINGAIINNHNLDGDVKAIQFMFDKNQIPSEESDNTNPLNLRDVCKNTSNLYNRGRYTKKPNILDDGYCEAAEEPNKCGKKDTQNSCLDSKCDWLNCEDLLKESDCQPGNTNGKCEYNSLRRKCLPKDGENDRNSGVCRDTFVSKCNKLQSKQECLNVGCLWDGKCHDTYYGKRKDDDDHENFDFKCPPNSAIYKIETVSSTDRKFGKGDLRPGVIKGMKFHCRDITTGKHTKIYDKNNNLNDYITIGKEPLPDEKRLKYDSVQCNIHVDEKNRNYPGFISNINIVHGKYGVNGMGVNLCSYFKGLK
jgi:hypothetical protein